MRVAKANALIRFAVTTKLIRTYVFAHAKCWYSQKAAHVFFSYYLHMKLLNISKSTES